MSMLFAVIVAVVFVVVQLNENSSRAGCFFFFALLLFFEVCQFIKKVISPLSIPANIHTHTQNILVLSLSLLSCVCVCVLLLVYVFSSMCDHTMSLLREMLSRKMITDGMYTRMARSKSKERIMQRMRRRGKQQHQR